MAKKENASKPAKAGSVRIKPEVVEAASSLAESTGYSVAQIVEMCLQDCLEAVNTGKPVMPRVAKIAIALKEV